MIRSWLRRRPPRPSSSWPDTPLDQVRWVVVDTESSGLDPRRDQLLAIGAVVIEAGGIDLSRQLDLTVRPDRLRATDSTVLHGLSPQALDQGIPPPEAITQLRALAADSPLLAFHARFDADLLAAHTPPDLARHWQPHWLDVAALARLAYADAPASLQGLDDWLDWAGLSVLERHQAAADALATAELSLILLHRLRRQGIETLSALAQEVGRWQRRQQPPGW